MTRSAKFLIFITIMTTVAAAEIICFAALRVPSQDKVAVHTSFARLTGSVMPAFYNEYRQSPVPEYPSAFDASLRSAVYGR
jgi:hypothetical protein